MAKYLDLNGLQSYHNGVKGLLANKVDKVSGKVLSTNDFTTTLKNKLDGIESGADVNKIEVVKVNGTALSPDSSKAVNVSVPSKLSQLTNDMGFVSSHQDISGKENISNKLTSFSASPTDINYPSEKLVKNELDKKLNASLKGVANGVAELDSTGKVPSSQLPSFVDDVLEYEKLASFPTTGETGKIYVAKDTNKTYRWSGSTYVEINGSVALGETSSTAYRGDRGKIAYDHSQAAHAPSNAARNVIVGVKINGTELSVDSNRKVNIDTSGKEDKSNKVTSFQASPDNTHYPSEKLVHDALANKADMGHSHAAISVSGQQNDLQFVKTITFAKDSMVPSYVMWNDAIGDEIIYELYSESNLTAISASEISTILAS